MKIFTADFGRALLAACLLSAGMWNCTHQSSCELEGRWTSKEGQDFVFQSGGKALWLTKFGSSFDTLAFAYVLDCGKMPASIDLTQFNAGPHVGKTLYGILEWSSDTTLRLRYEPGTMPDVRPEVFDLEQTMLLYKR